MAAVTAAFWLLSFDGDGMPVEVLAAPAWLQAAYGDAATVSSLSRAIPLSAQQQQQLQRRRR